MSTNPLVVSDWLRTPAPFNLKKHGPNAIFSGDNSVVEMREPEKYERGCVCYTSHPLPQGQVWEITILNTTSRWLWGLVSGCVLYLLYHLFMSVLVHYLLTQHKLTGYLMITLFQVTF